MNIKTGDEVIFIYAIVKADDYGKVSFPANASFAKAMEIGPVEELTDMENCKGWGAMTGIALAKLGRKLCPEIFAIKNPDGPNKPRLIT